MEHYEKEALCNVVNQAKGMLDLLHEKRDHSHELSEYWKLYGETTGYTDDSDETVIDAVETIQEMWEEQYEDFEAMSKYWSSFIDRFENLTKNLAKTYERYNDVVPISFLVSYPYEHSIIFKQFNCLAFKRERPRICKFLLNTNHKITTEYDEHLTFNIKCSDEADASDLLHKIGMFINGKEGE
mgnify:FL=1